MGRKVYLAFDDYVEDTQSTYSSTELNSELGAYDAFVLQVVTDDVLNATAITVQLEVSSDGRRWASKNAVPEVNSATLTSGATNSAQGFDAGTLGPAPSLVRLRVQLTNPFGGATRAHVKIYCSAGPAVGPFQPNHLAGCSLWLRSDLGIGLGVGSNVSVWSDQSGSGNDATTGPTPPTYSGGGLNGFPRVTGGSGGYMTGGFSTAVGAHTVFAAVSYPALSNAAAIAGTDGALAVNSGFAQFTETPTGIVGRTASGAGGIVSATTSDTSSLGGVGIYSTMASDSATVDIAVNGVTKATTAAAFTLFSCTKYILFGLGLPLQYNLAGDAYEYVVYNRALAASERVLVHRYLGGRYGIVVP